MDIFVTDVLTYKGQETVDGTNPSMIGNDQYNLLTTELQNSTATWKVLPMQNLMCGWSIIGVPQWIGLGNGTVLDDSNWDGYDTDRDRVLTYLDQNNIDNVVVLSGDSHVTIFGDLTVDPNDGAIYDASTGSGSVAVEMLPTSISRGNFDEMGFGWSVPIVLPILGAANPQHVHMELQSHGYGILDVQPGRCVGEVWFSDIMGITSTETFGRGHQVLDGANHWDRNAMSSPTPAKDISSLGSGDLPLNSMDAPAMTVMPNPVTDQVALVFGSTPGVEYTAEVFTLTGSKTGIVKTLTATEPGTRVTLDLTSLPNGFYVICVRESGATGCASVIVER
jgi:alkaline phosphatase D